MEQYIDKSAVVAEIERKIEAHKETLKNCDSSISEMVLKGSMSAYQSLLHFFDTLEVKEVDYERELSKYISNGIHRFFPNVDDDYCKMDSVIWQDYVIETAKHFFELGLKTKKGE
jgi:hypothetical protein